MKKEKKERHNFWLLGEKENMKKKSFWPLRKRKEKNEQKEEKSKTILTFQNRKTKQEEHEEKEKDKKEKNPTPQTMMLLTQKWRIHVDLLWNSVDHIPISSLKGTTSNNLVCQ